MRTKAVIGGTAVLVLMAALSACGGTSKSTSTDANVDAITTTTTPLETTTTTPQNQVIHVEYKSGTVVVGGGRVSVSKGQTVELKVAADVTDEIHLHGYDKSAPVAPGTPTTLTFVANIPGLFEVELEKIGKKLVDLEVKG